MKEYVKNPRNISEFELNRLKQNIDQLGDLGGITHDLNTDEIITGNQRVKTLNLDECEIKLIKELDEPNEQGTVAIGYIITPEGTELNYRQVRWDDEQREKANITANKLGGEWDFNLLVENFDKELLIDAGFDDEELNFPEDNFSPNINPETSNNEVTEEDIIKTDKDLNTHNNSETPKRTVLCPHCLKEFQIDDK